MNLSNISNNSEKLLTFIPNPDLSFVVIIVFTVSSLLLVLIAVSSTLFLIKSLVKKRSVPLSHHLMVNLCATDLVKALLFLIIYTTIPVGSWFQGSIMCKILPMCLRGFQNFSLGILTILARYHYYAISKPMELAKQKKWKMYMELSIYFSACVGNEVENGLKQYEEYIDGATRCVQVLYKRGEGRLDIAIAYFTFITAVHVLQIYYFIRVAHTLRKNSKNLGENKLGSCQRLRRNKKAVKTILTMVLVYDIVVLPSAVLRTLALYIPNFSAFRELSELLVLVYCCFNSTFYIWRDETLKKTVTLFFARTFGRAQ